MELKEKRGITQSFNVAEHSVLHKNNKGITLIALVITIIVMLILVAVTITLAVNGGLFQYAGDAATRTNEAIQYEKTLGDVPADLTTQGLIDYYTGAGETSGYGFIAAENIFVGQKSIGKREDGVEDNTQKTNWNESKNGYVFAEGHFIKRENYTYYIYNEQTGSYDLERIGTAYLCWDQDGVTPENRESTRGKWDIFSIDGSFLSFDSVKANH